MASLLIMSCKTVRGTSGLLREDHLCIWPGQQKISHCEATNSEFGRQCDMKKGMEKERATLTNYREKWGGGD